MVTIRVLLAEDGKLIRLLTAELLRDEGFKMTEARNGNEAAELPDSSDALFTDVRTPGTLDGVDVKMHLRQRRPAIPVLIASGHAAHLLGRQEVVAALNRTMVKL